MLQPAIVATAAGMTLAYWFNVSLFWSFLLVVSITLTWGYIRWAIVQPLGFTSRVAITLALLKGLIRRKWPGTHLGIHLPENRVFMTAAEAATLIPDGAVICATGLAANACASALFKAVGDRFATTQHPANCTVIVAGGVGGKGRGPGTIEFLGLKGLCTRMICGHAETHRAMLELASKGQCEFQIIPQGCICLLLNEIARSGKPEVTLPVGAGTFVDPRTGRGTCLAPAGGPSLVKAEADGKLTFTLPTPTCGLINAPAADRKGNIYMRGAAVLSESADIARAVKRNNGVLIVQVGKLVEEGYAEVYIPHDLVTAIVVNPYTEQTLGGRHTDPLMYITPEFDRNIPLPQSLAKIRYLNERLGLTPQRSMLDHAMSRLGASLVAKHLKQGDSVDVGTGLPEQVAAMLYKTGVLERLQVFCESGVKGGVPAPGAWFGASVHPEKMVPSAEIFRTIYFDRLDCIIVGALQVDSSGNVNASKRGEGPLNYVGPGGFMDFTCTARVVVFIAAFSVRASSALRRAPDGSKELHFKKHGQPKFVDQVDEITFSGKEALRRGQTVYYVTQVGAFKLTNAGVQLIQVMPGVDIQRDVLDVAKMRIILPEGGASAVPLVSQPVVTGRNFTLECARS